MDIRLVLARTTLFTLGFSLALFATSCSFAQGAPICLESQMQNIQSKPAPPSTSPAPSKIDPREEVEYKIFFKLKPENLERRLEVGNAFVQRYPNGPYTEAVYSQLTTAAYQSKDFAKMEIYADKAMALNPDDVTVLVFIGWVIPHAAHPIPAQLDKAERFERHALELLPTLAKPTDLSDAQFATAKSEYESQAHSGLGLVDYRRQDFQNAVAELKQATSKTPHPDPADLYVLGVSLDRLDRFSDAANAFSRCAAIPGAEQASCNQRADAARKLTGTLTGETHGDYRPSAL